MGSPQPVDGRFDQKRKRLRRGMYLLPSLFTTANMAFGYYAISQAMVGSVTETWHFDAAARAIGFAIVFDMFDGRIARMTQTTSDFGRELDSLADAITFGVAPAVLAWMWGFRLLPALPEADLRMRLVQLGAIATFLFMIAGASRLARFNIQVNPQPSNPGRPGKKYFVGMPIPAAAGVVAAIVHFARGEPLAVGWWSLAWLGLLVSCAFLMVSTWRFYSFKDINLRGRHPFRNVVFIGALIASIWYFSHPVLFVIALAYMLSGVLARVPHVLRRRSAPPPPPAYQGAAQ